MCQAQEKNVSRLEHMILGGGDFFLFFSSIITCSKTFLCVSLLFVLGPQSVGAIEILHGTGYLDLKLKEADVQFSVWSNSRKKSTLGGILWGMIEWKLV